MTKVIHVRQADSLSEQHKAIKQEGIDKRRQALLTQRFVFLLSSSFFFLFFLFVRLSLEYTHFEVIYVANNQDPLLCCCEFCFRGRKQSVSAGKPWTCTL